MTLEDSYNGKLRFTDTRKDYYSNKRHNNGLYDLKTYVECRWDHRTVRRRSCAAYDIEELSIFVSSDHADYCEPHEFSIEGARQLYEFLKDRFEEENNEKSTEAN
jgi:hypothetical protein